MSDFISHEQCVSSADADAIFRLCESIVVDDASAISGFGESTMQHVSRCAGVILSSAIGNYGDTSVDVIMNDILALVRYGEDVVDMSDKPLKRRVLSALSKPAIDRYDRHQTVQAQLTALKQYLGQAQDDMPRVNGTIEVVCIEVEDNYFTIGVRIADARATLQRMAAELDVMRLMDSSPFETKRLSDLASAMSIMDKRLGDFLSRLIVFMAGHTD
jgi:uncharacterized protein YaaN involved in tellurite resistance